MSRNSEDLKARIKESLMVCWDYSKEDKRRVAYLRFAPLETEEFRFGLSLNLIIGEVKEEHEKAKDAVAGYLVDAIEHLWEERS